MVSDTENKQPSTRKERREGQSQMNTQQQEEKSRKKSRLRLVPIWLRLLIVVILVMLSVSLGLMVGYGIIGNGEAGDAIKPSTWRDLIDLVTSGTPE